MLPFRNRFIKRLRSLRKRGKLAYGGRAAPLAEDAAWEALLDQLADETWIVYPKPTADDPTHAFDYLARYTHKVAISDHRIKAIKDGRVTYSWRDRNDDNTEKLDTIPICVNELGYTIGRRKLDRIPRTTSSRIRLTVLESRACPLIRSVGIHLDEISPPSHFDPAYANAEVTGRRPKQEPIPTRL